jgi:hypothetical protein
VRALALLVVALSWSVAGCTPMPPVAGSAIQTWRSGAPDADCEIPGESVKWQADYCMARMQTDDLVAAQACMDHESQLRQGEECARRRHYKREWCRQVVDQHLLQRSFAECIADPEQGGAIVKGVDLE